MSEDSECICLKPVYLPLAKPLPGAGCPLMNALYIQKPLSAGRTSGLQCLASGGPKPTRSFPTVEHAADGSFDQIEEYI